ncbi:hypothetical protein N0A02_17770 [Paraburkholderia acidicola]|uniref:Uncharacterized protein n=1 Tax=Paraburkholderia acidicola TaxID=1912599 RepID=A0ABV1LPV8_9BURK
MKLEGERGGAGAPTCRCAQVETWPDAGVAFWGDGGDLMMYVADAAQLSSPTLWRRLEAVKRCGSGAGLDSDEHDR